MHLANGLSRTMSATLVFLVMTSCSLSSPEDPAAKYHLEQIRTAGQKVQSTCASFDTDAKTFVRTKIVSFLSEGKEQVPGPDWSTSVRRLADTSLAFHELGDACEQLARIKSIREKKVDQVASPSNVSAYLLGMNIILGKMAESKQCCESHQIGQLMELATVVLKEPPGSK